MAGTLSHPVIGTIKGDSAIEGVTRYLGLQYATLKDKFAPAVLKQYDGQALEATKLGPQVPCFPPGPDAEFGLIQQTLSYDRSQQYTSETEGLNLNVVVPAGTNAEASFPVLAFIHGGGYNVGSATFPQYDMSRLVKLSVTAGTPIVALSLNYRLNAPGFLTSEELRNAGYQSNNALHDQQTALLWIQQNISGFGGDPKNVTLMGESAGGISVSYHLHFDQPLFRRAILMSGTHLLMPPAPLAMAEGIYAKAIKALELDTLTAEERVKALVSMPGQDLTTKLIRAGIPFIPVHDSTLVNFAPTFRNVTTSALPIPGREWCEALLIGDCQFDGNIMSLRLASRKSNIGSAFCTSISSSLPTPVATKFLAAYNVTPDTGDDEAFFHILQICNDLMFHAPTLSVAENFSAEGKPVYMYRFNEPNPWDGPWKGQATHILDLAFLLQNFNKFLDEPQRKQAEEFGRGVIAFANGKACWEAWTKGKKVAKMFGPEGRVAMGLDLARENGRRAEIFDLAKEVGDGDGLDVLNAALNKFMRGE